MTKNNQCPYCEEVISDYYKSNRYYYKEYFLSPRKYKENYIKDIGIDEYLEEIKTINELTENNQLDDTFYFIHEISDFVIDLLCPNCKNKLYVACDDDDNIIISAKFNEFERNEKRTPTDEIAQRIAKGEISLAQGFNEFIKLPNDDKPIEKQKKQYIYLLLSDHGTKIGRTIDIRNRMNEFQTKLPFEINQKLIFEVTDNIKLETELHRKYKNKRIKGEWFNLEKSEINNIIKELTA